MRRFPRCFPKGGLLFGASGLRRNLAHLIVNLIFSVQQHLITLLKRTNSSKRYRQTIESAANELVCPLTLELPLEPVMAKDGKIYERTAIEEHIAMNGSDLKSPVTNKPMGKCLLPVLQVRNVIEQLVCSGVIDDYKATRWNDELENKKKVAAFRQRADSGDTFAMYELSRCYYHGMGVKQDNPTAYSWSKKAADAGYVQGTAIAAWHLVYGSGVDKNVVLGMMLFARAEEAGSDVAAYMLGICFYRGDCGMPRDLVQAKKFLSKIAHGACKCKHLSPEGYQKASNLLQELDGPSVTAPELSETSSVPQNFSVW